MLGNWLQKICLALASGLGVGFIPFAPGTWGSLWGLPLAWALGLLPLSWHLLAVVGLCTVGVPIATVAGRALGGQKDPGAIVLDEIVALPIVFLFVAHRSPAVFALGFVLFRAFDVLKPPPANWLERLPEGLGVMADDWMAAVYACLTLHLLLQLGLVERLPLSG